MFKRPPQLFRDNVFSDESRAAQAEKLSRALAQILQTHHEQVETPQSSDRSVGARSDSPKESCHPAVF
jgi:hypothetical protein